jgi:hypothetical protein
MKLCINPEIQPTVDVASGVPFRFILDIPVRGRRRKMIEVTQESNPAFFQFLVKGTQDGQDWIDEKFTGQSYVKNNRNFLERIGFLVSENRISREPLFEPYWKQTMTAADFDFHLQRGKALPQILKGRLRGLSNITFGASTGVVWINDSRNQMFYPFLLKRNDFPAVQKLSDSFNSGHSQKENHRETQIASFAERKYVILENLFPAVVLKPLADYYKARALAGFALWDAQYRRFFFHNDPVSRFLHFQLKRLMDQLIGRPVKPSYSFASIYRSGAYLSKHTDREQCEYTLSVNIWDTPQGRAPWPFFLHTDHGKSPVRLQPGDGILFKGRELGHSRNKLQKKSSLQILFHFVKSDFKKPLS